VDYGSGRFQARVLIALANARESGGLILLHGYKDEKYIETALLAQRFDKQVIVVLGASKGRHGFPRFGKLGSRRSRVRAKLTARGVGRWADSAANRAKFGLTSSEIVEVVDRLCSATCSAACQLLISTSAPGLPASPDQERPHEAATIYVELAKMGAQMRYLTSRRRRRRLRRLENRLSRLQDYTTQEYAKSRGHDPGFLHQRRRRRSDLVTEAGRAVTATSPSHLRGRGANEVRLGDPDEPAPTSHPVLRALTNLENAMPKTCRRRTTTPSRQDEAQSLFKFGLPRSTRARPRRAHLLELLREDSHVCAPHEVLPEELDNLERVLAAITTQFRCFSSVPILGPSTSSSR